MDTAGPAAGPLTMRARAKLTLSLQITGVRSDGFHLLDAEMVTIDLSDELTFSDGDDLTVAGPAGQDVPVGDDNLVRRALLAVGRNAAVQVMKRIPAGAGLGGGSADAAAVLRWAGCTDLAVAAALGADVPFCLVGGRARVTGVGETVRPLPWVPDVYTLSIPPFGVSTADVYRTWDELGGPTGGSACESSNDLEPAALTVEPRLAGWRDALADASGETPILAGSGSTWFVPGAYPGSGRIVVRAERD